MNKNLTPIAQAWHRFRDLFQTTINRDIAMMSIGQQVLTALDDYNNQMYAQSEAGGSDGMDMSGNQCHWLQDLYVADDSSIFAISCSNGKLYRWPVIVGADNTVTLGQSQEVEPLFAPTPQAQTMQATHKRTDGRYAGFAIMGTCALNKDGEIDTRRLFDCFVERFKGNREYVNIYHLGGDTTKIGEITTIFREGNLLVGHYVLDDNPVAHAAGATLSADQTGEWGGSIEFLSDNEGIEVEIASGVKANMYIAGTLQGFSLARATHGAAWGTSHFLTRTPEMDKNTLASIAQLLGNNPEALTEFESWLDGANLRLTDSITRTEQAADQPLVVAQATEEVVQAMQDNGTMPPPLDGEIVVNDDLLVAITQAIHDSEWFKATATAQVELSTRLSSLEQTIADLQSSAVSTPAQPEAQPETQPTAQPVDEMTDRIDALEQIVNQLSSFYERSKPPAVQVATYRPGRSTTPQAQGAKPPAGLVVQQANAPAQPTSLKAMWKRPNKTLDRLSK